MSILNNTASIEALIQKANNLSNAGGSPGSGAEICTITFIVDDSCRVSHIIYYLSPETNEIVSKELSVGEEFIFTTYKNSFVFKNSNMESITSTTSGCVGHPKIMSESNFYVKTYSLTEDGLSGSILIERIGGVEDSDF